MNGYVYVSNDDSNNVSVVNGTTIVGTVNVGNGPYVSTVDTLTGDVYTPNYGSNNVSVIRNTTLVATVHVGSGPYSAVFDGGNGFVYVMDSNSSSVTVINGTSVVGNVSVGSSPSFATVDAGTGEVYVTNSNSNNVSVLSGSKVVGSPSVGTFPFDPVYDPGNGYVYVTNFGEGTVTVLNGTSVVGTVHVGSNPFFATYDTGNGDVYVANDGSNNVSVIHGTALVATLKVGSAPTFAVYDPGNGGVYVTNFGYDNVSVISGTTVVGSLTAGTEPCFETYDPGNGYIYVPDAGEGQLSVIEVAYRWNFSEVGLPSGTSWTVNVTGGPVAGSNSSALSFEEYYGTYAYSATSADPDYIALGGSFTLNGSSNRGTIVFSSGPYSVSFTETGLPVGIGWSVTLGTTSRSSTSPTISFTLPNGTYPYRLGYVPGWTPSGVSGSLTVNGKAVSEAITWSAMTYPVTIVETGLPSGTGWWINVTGGPHDRSIASNLSLAEPNGTYAFGVSSENRSWTATGGTFQVAGGATRTVVEFSVVLHAVQFTEVGLGAGTRWSISLEGRANSSTTGLVGFTEPNGTYPFAAGPVSGYQATPANGTLLVEGANTTQAITFTRLPAPTYSLVFVETGLAAGKTWSVALGGQSRSATGAVSFDGLANGTYGFTVGLVEGYAASPTSGSIDLSGTNKTQAIAFTLVGPGASSPTIFGLPVEEWYGVLGGIGTVAVGATAAVLWKRRTPPAP